MKGFPLRGLLLLTVATLASTALHAQEPDVRWERRNEPTEVPVTVFHSPQSANLPTAETIGAGEWQFEISHRFFPTVSQGADALWGFDGPVRNRFGLSYAPSDRVMLGVLRSNHRDNLELNAKARFVEGGRESIPFQVGAKAGVAWNTEVGAADGLEDNERQAYAQLMVNALLGGRFAVGVVPTLLNNVRIEDVETESAFVLGLHGQLYLSDQVSLLGEWIVSEERTDLEHDSGSFGIELETGGHFFKIILTNQWSMNPTQFLGGTPYNFEPDEWRVGFNITRLLAWGEG